MGEGVLSYACGFEDKYMTPQRATWCKRARVCQANKEIVYGIAAIAVGFILQMYSRAMGMYRPIKIPRIAASTP
jgi:hypothetical protein